MSGALASVGLAIDLCSTGWRFCGSAFPSGLRSDERFKKQIGPGPVMCRPQVDGPTAELSPDGNLVTHHYFVVAGMRGRAEADWRLHGAPGGVVAQWTVLLPGGDLTVDDPQRLGVELIPYGVSEGR